MNSFLHFFITFCISLAGHFHPVAASSQYGSQHRSVQQCISFTQVQQRTAQAHSVFIEAAGRGHQTGESDRSGEAETEPREEETELKDEDSSGAKKIFKDVNACIFLLPAIFYSNHYPVITFSHAANLFNSTHSRYILYSAMLI